MKRCLAVMLCASLLVALSQPVTAQDVLPGPAGEVRRACAVDFLRFCRDVPPGRGRVLLCMHLNADRLSPRCFEAMTAWGLAAVNAFKACVPDAQRYCSHVPPGMGRGLACLLQNADRLGPACRDAIAGQENFEPFGNRNGGR